MVAPARLVVAGGGLGGSRSPPAALPAEPGSPSPPARRGRSVPGSRGHRRRSPRSSAAPRCRPQRLHPPPVLPVPARARHQCPTGWGDVGGCKVGGDLPSLSQSRCYLEGVGAVQGDADGGGKAGGDGRRRARLRGRRRRGRAGLGRRGKGAG